MLYFMLRKYFICTLVVLATVSSLPSHHKSPFNSLDHSQPSHRRACGNHTSIRIRIEYAPRTRWSLFDAVRERTRVRVPREVAAFDADAWKERKELNLEFETGALQIPSQGLAIRQIATQH
mmetsp:Transcript_70059/g.116347  ORF Transcript_70059/g.116347 Transcript_70059/m.116347 type:complete len:121 (-) Transcript_70059:125-487(-)